MRSLIAGTQLSQFIGNYRQFIPIVHLSTVWDPLQLKLCAFGLLVTHKVVIPKNHDTYSLRVLVVCACVCVCLNVCMQKGDLSYTAFKLCGVPADWPNNPLKGDYCDNHHRNGSAFVCVCVCVLPL